MHSARQRTYSRLHRAEEFQRNASVTGGTLVVDRCAGKGKTHDECRKHIHRGSRLKMLEYAMPARAGECHLTSVFPKLCAQSQATPPLTVSGD